MRRAATALVWLLVIGVGTAGSELYKMWVLKDRVPLSSRVDAYRQTWEEALAHVQDVLAYKMDAAGLTYQRLMSGAGHDAQEMAAICPTAVLGLSF